MQGHLELVAPGETRIRSDRMVRQVPAPPPLVCGWIHASIVATPAGTVNIQAGGVGHAHPVIGAVEFKRIAKSAVGFPDGRADNSTCITVAA